MMKSKLACLALIGTVPFALGACTKEAPKVQKGGTTLIQRAGSIAQTASLRRQFIDSALVRSVPSSPAEMSAVASAQIPKYWYMDASTLGPENRASQVAAEDLRNIHNQFVPKSPVIHNYDNPDAEVPLIVSFPSSFIPTLPGEIRREIEKIDIDHLEIYFAPQKAVHGKTLPDPRYFPQSTRPGEGGTGIHEDHWQDKMADLLGLAPHSFDPFDEIHADIRHTALEAITGQVGKGCLKPEYWLFPQLRDLSQILDSPADLTDTVQMSIYRANSGVADGVRENQLGSFQVIIHERKVSPNTGHLSLSAGQLNYSFWSLVISQKQKRAVATLHWLMDEATTTEFTAQTYFHSMDYQNHPNYSSFRLLLSGLERASSVFSTQGNTGVILPNPQNLHMMQKLLEFVGESPQSL